MLIRGVVGSPVRGVVGSGFGSEDAAIYVDSVLGDDANPGTRGQPKQTLGAVTQSPGMSIRLKRGSEFRERLVLTETGIRVGAYGSGPLPRILGSTEVDGSWSYAAGVGSIALANAPSNVFVVDGDTVTKLAQNAATPTSPTSGQWGHSAGTLYINTGADPNTQRIEHVVYNASLPGVVLTADSLIEYVASWFHPGTGIVAQSGAQPGDRAIVRHCDPSWNCQDGVAGQSGNGCPRDNIVEYNTIWGNGFGPKDGLGADGDGVSWHGDSGDEYGSVVVRYNDIRYNTKSGIGNQSSVICDAYGNYFQDNFDNYAIYPVTYTGEADIRHRVWGNISRRTVSSERFGIFLGNGASPYSHAIAVEIYNNVVHSFAASSGSTGIFIPGGSNLTVKVRNNIVQGFARGVRDTVGGNSLDLDFNCVSGNTDNYYDNGTRSPALSTLVGANSISTDPQFTDAANGDFTIPAASPCAGAGETQAVVTEDYAREAITVPPSMGAYNALPA